MSAPHPLGLVDCSNEEYHSGPGVSKSHLDVVARSPLHYWQAYVNPQREPRVPTAAMVLGTAIHAAILEPDLFTSEFVVAPNVDRRTKTGKELWAEFCEEYEGYTVLDAEQWDVALGCRDSVHRHPLARLALASPTGKAEQSYYAIDSDTGLLRKCRLDWYDAPSGFALDVKSTVDASPEFIRSCLKYRYHVQEAWYRSTLAQATDYVQGIRQWVFLAVEKTPPYACAIYTLPLEVVKAGYREAARDLALIARCRDYGDWPGYPTEVTTLELSGWQRRTLGVDSADADFEGLDE